MPEPTVCCILLANGRAAMVRRAIASFRAQTYERKRLLVWDSGKIPALDLDQITPDLWYERCEPKSTIGALRNAANEIATHEQYLRADLIAHFDSDDWSHPRRLEEQVALLLASGKQAVGYRELVFWDTRDPDGMTNYKLQTARHSFAVRPECWGQAWIYRNHQQNWAAGASLLYRRELWERQPFGDHPHEDQRWVTSPAVSGELIGISAIYRNAMCDGETFNIGTPPQPKPGGPRLIAQMHGDNTEQISREKMLTWPDVWRRAPEMDEYCERTMRL